MQMSGYHGHSGYRLHSYKGRVNSSRRVCNFVTDVTDVTDVTVVTARLHL